jgi:DNA repair exonuclease SbcCD ATPase subunit
MPEDDELAALEALLVTMEQQRDEARRLLKQCTPADGARLAEAIAELEAKLAEAKKKRDVFAARRQRIARMSALQVELKALAAQLTAIPEAERRGPRGAPLWRRFEEIQGEAEALRKARDASTKD